MREKKAHISVPEGYFGILAERLSAIPGAYAARQARIVKMRTRLALAACIAVCAVSGFFFTGKSYDAEADIYDSMRLADMIPVTMQFPSADEIDGEDEGYDVAEMLINNYVPIENIVDLY